jgi:hypothetical protein
VAAAVAIASITVAVTVPAVALAVTVSTAVVVPAVTVAVAVTVPPVRPPAIIMALVRLLPLLLHVTLTLVWRLEESASGRVVRWDVAVLIRLVAGAKDPPLPAVLAPALHSVRV